MFNVYVLALIWNLNSYQLMCLNFYAQNNLTSMYYAELNNLIQKR